MFGTDKKKSQKLSVSGQDRKVFFRSSHRSMVDLHSPPPGASKLNKGRKKSSQANRRS